jgi:hypothetical protein
MFRRTTKHYRGVRDNRGGERFPWTVYGPGESGTALTARDLMPYDTFGELDARTGVEPAWRIEDRGAERVADVFRTRREAKQAAWLLENGYAHVDANAPLCWRVYRDI